MNDTLGGNLAGPSEKWIRRQPTSTVTKAEVIDENSMDLSDAELKTINLEDMNEIFGVNVLDIYIH